MTKKEKTQKNEKIKLRISEIISNAEARERIKGKIVCIIPEPLAFDKEEAEEESFPPDNMLALIEENVGYKIVTIPNDSLRNALVTENIPKEIIERIKTIEKTISEMSFEQWFDKHNISILFEMKKESDNNRMYV